MESHFHRGPPRPTAKLQPLLSSATARCGCTRDGLSLAIHASPRLITPIIIMAGLPGAAQNLIIKAAKDSITGMAVNKIAIQAC